MNKVNEVPEVKVETDVARMRVRVVKGGKKRPIMYRRPSLKKVNSNLKKLRSQTRFLRGALRRTGPLESERQMELNTQLGQVATRRGRIMSYVKSMTEVKPRD